MISDKTKIPNYSSKREHCLELTKRSKSGKLLTLITDEDGKMVVYFRRSMFSARVEVASCSNYVYGGIDMTIKSKFSQFTQVLTEMFVEAATLMNQEDHANYFISHMKDQQQRKEFVWD